MSFRMHHATKYGKNGNPSSLCIALNAEVISNSVFGAMTLNLRPPTA
jgi:hypothetical protein